VKPVVAISGFKDSGKTTLCLALASRMKNMGIQVGFIKRTHEAGILGSLENDTGLLLGENFPTVLWGPDGLRAESREESPDLDWMIERFMPGVDFVLLEGGKGLPLPRVWVGPPGDCPEGLGGIMAWYDRNGDMAKPPFFTSGQEDQLARFLVERLLHGRTFPSISLHVDGRKVFLKPYLEGFLGEAILGMVRSLKDTDGKEISIRIRRENRGSE
jgi:molybdopterin-guanine dinucleotide biosynthesis protein B